MFVTNVNNHFGTYTISPTQLAGLSFTKSQSPPVTDLEHCVKVLAIVLVLLQ